MVVQCRMSDQSSDQYIFPTVTGGVYKIPVLGSPRRADARLLAIPTSRGRVADHVPNLTYFPGFADPFGLASDCICHCSTCVAHPIRAILTCRRPHLPPSFPQQYHGSVCPHGRGFVCYNQLRMRLKPQTADGHATPVTGCATNRWTLTDMQEMVRFFA